MELPSSKEKLVHAIIFFAQNTTGVGKVKLYKLLAFLDFEHYQLTGRTVTGLEYFAWPKGPVPVALESQIKDRTSAIHKAIAFVTQDNDGGYDVRLVRPKIEFDEKVFSRKELKIMRRLAEIFREADAGLMIDATHMPNEPWDITYNKLGLKQKRIDFKLALKNPGAISEETADEIAAEDRAMDTILKDA